MKILLVSHYPKGGVNTYIQELIKGMGEANIEYYCYFFCDELEYTQEMEEENFCIFRFNLPLQVNINLLSDIQIDAVKDNFRTFLMENKFDIIDFQHLQYLGASLVEVAHELNIPNVLTLHDYWVICPNLFLLDKNIELCDGPKGGSNCVKCYPNQHNNSKRYYYFKDILINKTNNIITVSHSVANKLIEEGIPNTKLNVVYPALSNVQMINQKKKFDKDRIKIAYLGALSTLKGIHLFLEAFERLKYDNVEFHIFGTGPSFREIIKKNTIHNNFHWHGSYNHNEISILLKDIDLIIIPSIVPETGPLTAQEALRNGIPIIGSKIGGIPEYITEDCGMLFEPGNVEDLIAKIKKVLDYPDETLGKWTCKNNILVDNIKFVNKVLKCYQDTIEKKESVLKIEKKCSSEEICDDHLKYLYTETVVTERALLNFSVPKVVDLIREKAFDNIAIFGFGKNGKKLFDFFKEINKNIVCFLDNNLNFKDREYLNTRIYSPQTIRENNIQIDLIIVVADREDEIFKQLFIENFTCEVIGLKEIYKQANESF